MLTRWKEKYIGDRAFMKAVLVVAVPMMAQQLITSSVNLVDNLMVGQLGDAALGGVAAVNRYYMIAFFGTNGLMAAVSIFIAQFFGAQNIQKQKEAFRFAVDSAALVMVLFWILGLVFPKNIVGFFTQDPTIVQLGTEYLSVAVWTFLPLAISLSAANAIRAIGETKTPFHISAIAVVTNTILNYCLIFGKFGAPELGVVGAAIATLIARVLEAVLYLVVLYKNEYPFDTNLKDMFKIPSSLARHILSKAAPLALNEVLWSSGMATLYRFYATRGPEVLSGYSISSTISDIFFTLFGGMAAASTVLIAQHLGANELETAKKNAYHLIGFAVMLSLVFALAMFGFTFVVPYLYTNVSPEAKEVAKTFLRVQSCLYWIYMVSTQCYFTLRAGGDMKHTLMLDSLYMWTCNIPLVCAVTYLTDWPILAIYLTGQFTDVIKMFIAMHLVRKEHWVVNLAHREKALD